MSEVKINLHGRCLCGSVEISTDKATNNVSACHCTMCRRWTGGPLLIVDCGDKVTVKGEKNISIHQTTEFGERAFCTNCGSSLYYHYFDTNKYFVAAGLFEFEDFNFDRQIFIDEKPSYYSFSNETENTTGKVFCNIKYGKDEIEKLDSYLP